MPRTIKFNVTLFLDKINVQEALVDRMKCRLRSDSIRSFVYSVTAAYMSVP